MLVFISTDIIKLAIYKHANYLNHNGNTFLHTLAGDLFVSYYF